VSHGKSPLAPERFPDLPPVRGMRAGVGRVGLYKHMRDELLVAHFPNGASVGGAFTTSSTRSPDVDWCRRALVAGGGRAQALVVNAGNSNAFTGAAGAAKNAATVATITGLAHCPSDEVFLAATGVIGQPLPPNKVADCIPPVWAALDAPEWPRLAGAIATTDTYPKGAGRTVAIDGVDVHIAGIAKGSGMIAPNMATMLVFLFTDADLSPAVAQALISKHVDLTFNTITVDGDTSTSDTLLLFATGASGAPRIEDPRDPRLAVFEAALHETMLDLALQVVKDGEGAEKIIRIEITGAVNDASARRIGLAIGNSPLLKTAVAGGDANWGRVVMAVGKSGEPIALEKLAIRMGGVWTARDGGAIAYDEKAVDAHFAGRSVDILVDVGLAAGGAVVWTCDLTKRYIEINGDYRS
jgi:glutamate N-acetyltransferase/amino-acid N-acetyltransferase